MSCKLCLENVPLARSHVIPKFVYAHMYDQRGHYAEVCDVDAGKVILGQDGVREKLLCSKCESRFNRYERHARRLFVDELPQPQSAKSRRIQIPNLDYCLFKLFILSVVWRAGVSSAPFFQHVKLGPHADIIRGMLNSEDPGPPDVYPCVIRALMLEGEHLRGFMVEPVPVRIEGHKAYYFVFGGFLFIVFISGHELPPIFERACLTDKRPVFAFFTEIGDVGFLREVWNRAGETTRDVKIRFGED